MSTRMVEAVHVAPEMTLVHHETRAEYEVLQNAKVNQVLVVRDADGHTWKAPYDDYQQPVEILDQP
jgi:YD repeat-containing protein